MDEEGKGLAGVLGQVTKTLLCPHCYFNSSFHETDSLENTSVRGLILYCGREKMDNQDILGNLFERYQIL